MAFKSSTVNSSKVAATLSDFPSFVLPSRIGITTLVEAQSSRFYADSGKVVEWAREIVSATEIHVKIPSLTTTVTQYCDYDGIRADYAVTDTYGRNTVWTGYRAVWHLDGLTDSTGNGYTLTNNNTVTLNATGKLGGAADFTSGNTNKTLSIASELGINASTYTVDMWVRKYSVATYGQGHWVLNAPVVDRRIYGYYENSGGASFRFAHEGTANTQFNTAVSWSDNQWLKNTQTWDGTTLRGYNNGTSGGTGTPTGNSTVVNATFRLGAHQGDPAPSLYWQGLIDEARVSNDTKSANWITTEHNNQSDESTFWGAWADVGGAVQNSSFLAFM